MNKPRLPSNIHLEEIQKQAFCDWSAKQKKMTIDEHDAMYGGATMTSAYRWECRSGSVCDEIKVFNEHTKQSLDLTIDDDGVGVWTY